MVRKTGMKIMDKDGISSVIPFAAVLLVEGEELNTYLRNLENPQHTAWQPNRSENTPAARREARQVISEMRSFIVESLKTMQNLDARDSIDPSVGEFLAFIEEKEKEQELRNEDRVESITDKIKTLTLKPMAVRVPANSNLGTDGNEQDAVNDENGTIVEEGPPGEGSGSAGGQNGENGGGGGGNNPGNGSGSNPGGNIGSTPSEHRMKPISVKPVSERLMCLDKKAGKYVIIFKPSVRAIDGTMKIFQSAESQSYDAALTSVSCDQENVTFEGNEIRGIEFEANKPIRIEVTLDFHDYSALEVKA